MLSPGNSKLGRGRLIWTFSLPSRHSCPGRSATCSACCYSYRIERRRPHVLRRYRRNLALSSRRDFVERVVAFIGRRQVGVVRLHVGGDFRSPGYARRWLRIMRRCPHTTFYFYTRSWRLKRFRPVLAAMARLGNVRAWYSCDRDTGVPRRVPPGVRLAWLMTDPDDLPPRADLVFRVPALRRQVQKRVLCGEGQSRALVCPVENGVTGHRTTCGQCGVCWRVSGGTTAPRLSLPLIQPSEEENA
jgi:hypothetical protein